MARQYDYEIIRRASKDWICARCNEVIEAGTQYNDRGWRTSDLRWHHVRTHIKCNEPQLEMPMPVSLRDGTKEWLLGAVYTLEGGPALLTHDWEMNGKHHYRTHVYDEHGKRISVKEFL